MDKYELAQYNQNILQTALINQKEISELVGDEELLTIHEIHHGFHMSSRYKIGISLPNEDSFYDSFRQGLEEHDILTTVYELKETCKSFASHPPKWFEEEIVNRSNETRFNENWAGFLKTVYVENNWNDPLVQGWILCNKYNVKLYLIENNIDEENEYYVTRIVQNYSCEIVLSALIVSGQTKITIVNFGNHHFYPLVDTLAQMLKGKFGDVNYNKISRNKKKVNNTARGPTILENSLNYDVKPDILVKLNSLESTIKEGDINTFKKLLNDLYSVDRNALIEVYRDPKNNIINTNLLVLACKYNKLDILQYLINDFYPLHTFPLTDIKNNYKYKDDAIFYATLTFNKDMLVTLYDHFVDELHWSFNHHNKNIVENLKELNTILVKTSVNCEITLQENRQMSADLRCLIEVSKFQIELYTELDKIQYEICNSEDKRQVETETTVNIILTVIRIYNKYNLKYIKLRNNPPTVERRIQIVLADKTSNFMENNHKFVFDLYYRKLDLNAALLILDNLHYLQQRLELPSKYYNEIESALYYFIYRVYEDWRLFLPQNRMITRVELLLESHLEHNIGSVYDKTKLLLGPVLYLSRTYFCDELKKFGEVLQTTEIEKNIRKKGKKLSLGEINKLTLLPLMRDHFSLKKILVYLESMSKVDLDNDRDFAILMIERTIQVIGELLKISNESIHISLVTESLIEFMIPSETIRYLRKMRDILSRFKIPQLLKRIHIMNAESDCFKQVIEDLNDIKERIYYIIEMYHPILDKWILEQGLSILDKRIKELPVKKMRILKIQLLKMPPLNLPDSFIEYEDKLLKEHKISRQLLREINTLYNNHNELTAIYKSVRIYSKQQISAKMDTVSTIILKKLRYIEKNAKLSQCLDEWEFIVKIFEYIVISMKFFDDHPYEIKHSAYSNMIENIKNKNSIRNGLVKAFDLLAAIQNHAASYNITKENLLDDLTLKVNLENEFTGIKFLKIELQKCYNFIINEELKYVINDFKNAYGNEADVYSSYENVLNKIKNNIPIQSRDYKAICSLNLNDESKRIISYLDSKGKRTLKLGYCFENRISLLKQLSGINVSVHDLASRYKHDERFRLCLEMLLIDIMNILKHTEQKATLKKENKLYTDANIRNILEHSEPLLEDIGKALDPNDFATALAKKAIEFIENAEGWLDALNKLKK